MTNAPSDEDTVLVNVDDDWHPATLHKWIRDASGATWAAVTRRDGRGHARSIWLPEQRVWTAD